MEFAICSKQRQKFVNNCLRVFASAISTNLIYFFDLRIFPTCVTIQYTGNLYTARIISIKIIIINPSIEIRFWRVWYCARSRIEQTSPGRSCVCSQKLLQTGLLKTFPLKMYRGIQIPYSSNSIGVVELFLVS